MIVKVCDRCNKQIPDDQFNERGEIVMHREYKVGKESNSGWHFRIAVSLNGRSAHLCHTCLRVITDERYDKDETKI